MSAPHPVKVMDNIAVIISKLNFLIIFTSLLKCFQRNISKYLCIWYIYIITWLIYKVNNYFYIYITPSLIFFPNLLAVLILSSSSKQASNLPSIACASAILR